MKRLDMDNGSVVDADVKPRLDCTDCGALTHFRQGANDGYYCQRCGKRHSKASLVDANAAGVREDADE